MRAEDLKCFEFDGGEQEYIIARTKEEAIEYYKGIVGDDIDEYEIREIKDWHNMKVRVELPSGKYEEMTFLEDVTSDPSPIIPYIIATTAL
ncbi:hypothetical protein [Caloranaerobacter sp. DY30410]|uniref:hypothetical protein n=1 Tax=Caloranaerobacter sp. DY30410 TaxID=3238305 RepID=UPI003D060D2B